MKKILVIDGQGGKIGSAVIERIKAEVPIQEIYAIGTNSFATAAMLRSGADYAATGENPVKVNCLNADIIIGPMGIISANSLLGEVTPAMAMAIGQSSAIKVLLPLNKCNLLVVGLTDRSFPDLISLAVKQESALL